MTDAEKSEMQALKDRNAELEAAARTGEENKKLAEKKGKFDVMLSEGKAVEAQREHYMKGDIDAMMAIAVPAKTTRLSDAGAGDNDVDGEKDPQDEIMKLSDAMVKDGKAKDKISAMSKVLSDPKNKALRDKYEASSYNMGQART